MSHPPTIIPAPTTQAPALLRLWRVVHPDALDPSIGRRLLVALQALPPPTSCPDWAAALDGDAAAMVRVALVILRVDGPADATADMAATGLLVHALGRDPTAPAVLALYLRRLAALRPDDRRLTCLAAAWARRPRQDQGGTDDPLNGCPEPRAPEPTRSLLEG
ncbi:hypothetical protein [Methylorubrum extorquens]|uniref:Uncharacterized protein n=1 Tax=Methylorubrum extorquens (strain CM4 / NCIMB 13688) TaxID=440085 RepID=B7L3I5_METC4|nr:hypothetical protein [Methylorubrum extorquens]ACK86393.1 hypothetical protein Mchl_5671 [Methylorubrum extorquens CM4]